SIWSGVGEVNTSPGQAASSMPMPTKPPCIGSWPQPPPDASPPLPARGASARTMTLGSNCTLTRSGCAAAIPCSASVTTSSGLLISFLTRLAPPRVGADDDVGVELHVDEVRVRRCDSVQRLGDDVVRLVDQLLHSSSTTSPRASTSSVGGSPRDCSEWLMKRS